MVVVVAAVSVAVGFFLLTGERHHVRSLCQVVAPLGRYQLTVDQGANAATIAAVGKAAGLSDHAVTVALAAALQESGLHDLPGGDRDSVGLFQQRPSQGWGTREQLLEPRYAAKAFYDVLRTVPGWDTLPVTEAAQLVQRSAAPDAYAPWERQARAMAEALTGEIAGGVACQYDSSASSTPSVALSKAMESELGSASFTVPGEAQQWLVAQWLATHASTYRLTSISFGQWKWSSSRASWTSSNANRSQLAVTVAGRSEPALSASAVG